jgi:hypothetical protein
MPDFLDKMFSGAEAIVGGLEKSKELAEPYPNEDKVIDAEYKHTNAKLVWGVDKEVSTWHLFSDFTTTGLCGRYFDANQLTNRKTELEDGNYKCCGGCLRILQSRYERG